MKNKFSSKWINCYLFLSILLTPIISCCTFDEDSTIERTIIRTAVTEDFNLLSCSIVAKITILPEDIPSSEPFTVGVILTNTGTVAVPSLPKECLTPAEEQLPYKKEVLVSYHLFNKSSGTMEWDFVRTPLLEDLLSDKTTYIDLNVSSITNPKNHTLYIDLVNVPYGWATNTVTPPFLGELDLGASTARTAVDDTFNLNTCSFQIIQIPQQPVFNPEQLIIPMVVVNSGIINVPCLPDKEDSIRRVFLSYHLQHKKTGEIIWEFPRTPLTRDLIQGSATTLAVNVTNIPNLENYLLQVDMVHEHVRWYSREKGIIHTIDLADYIEPIALSPTLTAEIIRNANEAVEFIESEMELEVKLARKVDSQDTLGKCVPHTTYDGYSRGVNQFTLLGADGKSSTDRSLTACSYHNTLSFVLADFTGRFALLRALDQTGIKNIIFGASYCLTSQSSFDPWKGRPLQIQPHTIVWNALYGYDQDHKVSANIRFFSTDREYQMQDGHTQEIHIINGRYAYQSRFVDGISIDQATNQLFFSVVDIRERLHGTRDEFCLMLTPNTRIITAHLIDTNQAYEDSSSSAFTARAMFASLIRDFVHPNPGHYLKFYNA